MNSLARAFCHSLIIASACCAAAWAAGKDYSSNPASNPVPPVGPTIIVDPPPGGGSGPTRSRFLNGVVGNVGEFMNPGTDTPPPPPADPTVPSGGPSGGGGGGGSSGGGGGGIAGMPASAPGAAPFRNDILPGQMDAGRSDKPLGDGAIDGGAPNGAVSVLTQSSPRMLGGASGAGGRGHAQDLLHEAQNRMRIKDYAGAAAAARQAVAEDPKNERALTTLAIASNKAKDFNAAEEAASLAAKLHPKSAAALQNKAWAELHEKKLAEAVADADQAIKLRPDVAGNHAIKAYAESLLGKKDEALKDLEDAAAIDPRFMGRVQSVRQGGVMFDPDNDDFALADDIAGKAPASRVPAAGKVSGLVLLVVGAWLGSRFSRKSRQAPPARPAQAFTPVRFLD